MDDGSIEASGLRIQSQDQLDMMEEGVAGGNGWGWGEGGKGGRGGKGQMDQTAFTQSGSTQYLVDFEEGLECCCRVSFVNW